MSDQRPPNAAVMFTGRDSVLCSVSTLARPGDDAACSRGARRRVELSERQTPTAEARDKSAQREE